jgi:uncharacterized repeat protein (TIGR03837 family)
VAVGMAAHPHPPVWINVEYLSAEPFVERVHGLPSPRQWGPAAGLTQWYFQPGFTPGSGGLVRERDLNDRLDKFSRSAWLQSGIAFPARARHEDRRLVSLFCYANPALEAVIEDLSAQPTTMLAAAGRSATQVARLLGGGAKRDGLEAVALPRLAQPEYDHLLWSAGLNFVRGEDSFVRAQWAGQPFIWQIYPQQDNAHHTKLDSFLDRFLAGAAPQLADRLRHVFSAWNGLEESWPGLPDLVEWQRHCEAWRDALRDQSDLSVRLIRFVASKC